MSTSTEGTSTPAREEVDLLDAFAHARRSCPNARSKNDELRGEGASPVPLCYLTGFGQLHRFLSSSLFSPHTYIRPPRQHHHHTSPSPAYHTFIGRRSFSAFLDCASFSSFTFVTKQQNNNLSTLSSFGTGLTPLLFWRSSLACSSFGDPLLSNLHFSPAMRYSLFTTGLCALAWSGVAHTQIIASGQLSCLPCCLGTGASLY